MAIDLNRVNLDELSKIETIGKDKAQQIIDLRNKLGGFKSLEDLKQIPGISDLEVNALKMIGVEAK